MKNFVKATLKAILILVGVVAVYFLLNWAMSGHDEYWAHQESRGREGNEMLQERELEIEREQDRLTAEWP